MLNILFGYGEPLDKFIFSLFILISACIAIVLHEVSHGLVAKWNGDYTAKYAGRLSLNPVKHFDLFGFLMFAIVGFGYAKPVPVNPSNFKHYRRGLFTVAIAGICMNLILAFFSAMLYVLMVLGMNNAGTVGGIRAFYYFGEFFRISCTLNLSLVFFNLLPIFPLDGFRIVETFTHQGNKFCSFMRINGRYLLLGLVGLSIVVDMAFSYVSTLPYWFTYFDILGTYLDFFVGHVGWAFTRLWSLIVFRV